MQLAVINQAFSVCQVKEGLQLDLTAEFMFLAKTDEEISLVCPSGSEPADCLAVEPGWRAFRVVGQLDFSLIGILAGIANTLANAGISIFAISTFKTDYILVRSDRFDAAVSALLAAGYDVVS